MNFTFSRNKRQTCAPVSQKRVKVQTTRFSYFSAPAFAMVFTTDRKTRVFHINLHACGRCLNLKIPHIRTIQFHFLSRLSYTILPAKIQALKRSVFCKERILLEENCTLFASCLCMTFFILIRVEHCASSTRSCVRSLRAVQDASGRVHGGEDSGPHDTTSSFKSRVTRARDDQFGSGSR